MRKLEFLIADAIKNGFIGADEIIDLLEELSNSVGTAILMSTHNFPLIRPRQKRFIEIDQGKQITHDI